jgi:hypothetical protein
LNRSCTYRVSKGNGKKKQRFRVKILQLPENSSQQLKAPNVVNALGTLPEKVYAYANVSVFCLFDSLVPG